ncbi:DUF3035 domain-containing protein [Magnetovibrio sp.]|uniref:DUF3035 domain-containing protein n=1 Tax=Magnetovibrio sp. TaxID=2024836 RepID=UPI002F94808B
MKHIKLIALGVVAAVALTGCDGARKALTQTKAAPDEFSVYTRAPLTLPPDYGLRPPSEAEAEARKDDNPQDIAKRVMLSGRETQAAPIQASTPGTTALLARAGAQNAEPDIRQIVNRETSVFAEEDQNFMESLMFEPDPGHVVEPKQELQRIQENQALGKPVNDGETPVVEKKSKAPLEGLFDGWFK